MPLNYQLMLATNIGLTFLPKIYFIILMLPHYLVSENQWRQIKQICISDLYYIVIYFDIDIYKSCVSL